MKSDISQEIHLIKVAGLECSDDAAFIEKRSVTLQLSFELGGGGGDKCCEMR